MDMLSIQIISFIVGCGLTCGASLSTILWMVFHPPSKLSHEMLFASEWVVFKRYFLVPAIGVAVGIVLMIVPFVLEWWFK